LCVFFLLPVVMLVVEITALRNKILKGFAILSAGERERDSAQRYKLRKNDRQCIYIGRFYISIVTLLLGLSKFIAWQRWTVSISLPRRVRSVGHPASCRNCPPETKTVRHEAGYSSPRNAEANNAWSFALPCGSLWCDA
jgi:hypothetical protein